MIDRRSNNPPAFNFISNYKDRCDSLSLKYKMMGAHILESELKTAEKSNIFIQAT